MRLNEVKKSRRRKNIHHRPLFLLTRYGFFALTHKYCTDAQRAQYQDESRIGVNQIGLDVVPGNSTHNSTQYQDDRSIDNESETKPVGIEVFDIGQVRVREVRLAAAKQLSGFPFNCRAPGSSRLVRIADSPCMRLLTPLADMCGHASARSDLRCTDYCCSDGPQEAR